MGNTDSPGTTPAATSSYSLDDIYDRLDTGATVTQDPFAEPTAPTGTGTMHTIDEIMALIPDRQGSFTGAEGERTLTIPDGIYTGSSTATIVDADLSEENIRVGFFTIFGVWGENEACVTCAGTPSDGGRWCDNGDGTITDMTNGLVWLKDAGWGGAYPWRGLDSAGAGARFADAFWRTRERGVAWRLPTELELAHLYLDPEGISRSNPVHFDNIQDGIYWTSTSDDSAQNTTAWGVDFSLATPASDRYVKDTAYYVWPVHGSQP